MEKCEEKSSSESEKNDSAQKEEKIPINAASGKPLDEKKRIYDAMRRHLLAEHSLEYSGYPRMDKNGKVTVRQCDTRAPPTLDNPHERLCHRCRKKFVINSNGTFTPSETCRYHDGGVWNLKHRCCQKQKGSPGCSVAQSHVHRENRIRDLEGYVKTQSSVSADDQWDVYCLDCEMIYTSHGLEVAHVTLVDSDLKIIIDELIKPEHPVVEWNTRALLILISSPRDKRDKKALKIKQIKKLANKPTEGVRYSGITESIMRPVTTTLSDVQQRLLALINDKTILVGHSPQFDLTAIKLVHSNIIDTSEVFMDGRYRKPLRELVKDKLGRTIQSDKSVGHDSKEDAVACMELLMWKIEQDSNKRRKYE